MEPLATPPQNVRRRLASPHAKARRTNAHIFPRAMRDWYVEPEWVARRLFETVRFEGRITDPCCGGGNILKAAMRFDYDVDGYDIINRGFPLRDKLDFLNNPYKLRHDNIVMNPPFKYAREFAEKALASTRECVAMIFPTRRLNAARWIEQHERPFIIYHLTPRPSMLPGKLLKQGVIPKGGKTDYVWIVWYPENPTRMTEHWGNTTWLHRDG